MNKRHLICQLEVLIPLTEQAAKIIYKNIPNTREQWLGKEPELRKG